MKLSLMPTWTCSGPTNCHLCHQVPLVVPLTPYKVGLIFAPLTKWVCALKHLLLSWKGPCTHKNGSWSHHLVEDVEDAADGDVEDLGNDVEDCGDGVEVLADNGESLYGLKKH